MTIRRSSVNPEGSQERGRKFVKCIRNLLSHFYFYKGNNPATPFGTTEGFQDRYTKGEDPSLILNDGFHINFDFIFLIKNDIGVTHCFGEAKFRSLNDTPTDLEKEFLKFLKDCVLGYNTLNQRFENRHRLLFITNQIFNLTGIEATRINDYVELKRYLYDTDLDNSNQRQRREAVQGKINDIRHTTHENQLNEDVISQWISENLIIWIIPVSLFKAFLGDDCL